MQAFCGYHARRRFPTIAAMDTDRHDKVLCEKCGWLHPEASACSGNAICTEVKVTWTPAPSDKKLRYHRRVRTELNSATGKQVRVVRIINKTTDAYYERVTDIESGDVIHECAEPLSQHRGRGTAKPLK
jgi:hypothetical protein